MDKQVGAEHLWFKIVEFLQQNWAILRPAQSGVQAIFFDDGGRVFDWLEFGDVGHAERALTRNGFRRFAEDVEALQFISRPTDILLMAEDRPRPIYSSGQFWH